MIQHDLKKKKKEKIKLPNVFHFSINLIACKYLTGTMLFSILGIRF